MRKIALIGIAIIMASSVLVPSSANADRPKYWNIYDGRDSRVGIDTQLSYLTTRHRGYLTVTFKGYEYLRERLNVATVYLDTNRRNPGPEYGAQWALSRDRDGHAWRYVRRLDSITSVGRRVRCPRFSASVHYGRDVVRLKVPRRCVGGPGKVRWTGYTARIGTYRKHAMRGYADWLNGGRFIPQFWVGRALPPSHATATHTTTDAARMTVLIG